MIPVDDSLMCYIQDLNTRDNPVSFNGEKPTGFTDSYSANYESQSVRGRSSPYQSYNSSGPRQVSFDIKLSLDYNRNLVSIVDRLRDMFKPYRVSYVQSPRVRVVIGNMISIEAVPMSFNAVWSDGYKEGIYRICTLSFTFTEVEDTSSFDRNSITEIGGSATPTVNVSADTELQEVGSEKYLNLSMTTYGFTTRDSAISYRDYATTAGGIKISAGQYPILSKYNNIYKIRVGAESYWIYSQVSDLAYASVEIPESTYNVYGYSTIYEAMYGKQMSGNTPVVIPAGTYTVIQVSDKAKQIKTSQGTYWVRL